MGIKTSVVVELEPFNVPSFVRRVDGEQEYPGIPLGELSAETLDKLCDELRTAVFKKAGKELPAEQGYYCPRCTHCREGQS